jgi:hypothetical protein
MSKSGSGIKRFKKQYLSIKENSPTKPKYQIRLIIKGSKDEINEKTWQRKGTRDKTLCEGNKKTTKTKENEKRKEEVI